MDPWVVIPPLWLLLAAGVGRLIGAGIRLADRRERVSR